MEIDELACRLTTGSYNSRLPFFQKQMNNRLGKHSDIQVVTLQNTAASLQLASCCDRTNESRSSNLTRVVLVAEDSRGRVLVAVVHGKEAPQQCHVAQEEWNAQWVD